MDTIECHSCWDHVYEDCAAPTAKRLEARLATLTAALATLIAAFELALSEQGHHDHAAQTDPDTMCLDCWSVREAQSALDVARAG